MRIEVHTNGVLKYQWRAEIDMPDVAAWEDRVRIREAAMAHYLHAIQEQVMRYFDPATTVFYIVFESKMKYHETDMETPLCF